MKYMLLMYASEAERQNLPRKNTRPQPGPGRPLAKKLKPPGC